MNKEEEPKKVDSTTPALDFFSINLSQEANEGKIDNII
jgi:hypothetical protein